MSVRLFRGPELICLYLEYRAVEHRVLSPGKGWQDIGSEIPEDDLRRCFREMHVANMAEWLETYEHRHGGVKFELQLPPMRPLPEALPDFDPADRDRVYALLIEFRLLHYNASQWAPPAALDIQLRIERNLTSILMKAGELERAKWSKRDLTYLTG